MESIIPKLYANYGRTSDNRICKLLQKMNIYRSPNLIDFYSIGPKALAKMRALERPRTIAVNFQWFHKRTPISNLSLYTQEGISPYENYFPVLCKSSSRFFLKLDMGEIFDNLPDEILDSEIIKGIVLPYTDKDFHIEVPYTQGEHFICRVYLVTIFDTI